MTGLLVRIAIRLVLCAIAAWLFWRWKGPFGLVFAAPLWGVALARPLIDLVSEGQQAARRAAYAGIEGRHFAHHGHAIDIVDADDHHRWLSIVDVRKVIPGLPREATLQRQFPDGVRDMGGAKGWRIRGEDLMDYLSKATEPDSVRFRNWLDRDVVRPAAIARRRRGIGNARALRVSDEDDPAP